MSVRAALALINQTLDEVLAEQEGDFDVDSRWALAWFEQHGFDDGDYGVAETLSKAKNTSVAGMVDAGIMRAADLLAAGLELADRLSTDLAFLVGESNDVLLLRHESCLGSRPASR